MIGSGNFVATNIGQFVRVCGAEPHLVPRLMSNLPPCYVPPQIAVL